ncbi:hypothetical protein [Noviherbaspirillum sp. UKPF54]|uniref:hypothetical protein n=1 Tax=Noviherbaspirillum sp. UKPF54 TaxID=2601898 RepID=UPI0011B17F30|nr:hypothetical protein [Noviherbaspirillum sp. UKPF54]QDZ28703.1 hypothetical protein FAY22_12525 [Noviherbaspirillum sp. UKPF54]
MTSDLSKALDRSSTELAAKQAWIPADYPQALATGEVKEAEAIWFIEHTAAWLEWSVSAVVQRE